MSGIPCLVKKTALLDDPSNVAKAEQTQFELLNYLIKPGISISDLPSI
jgi:hypothetical protein